MAISNFACCFNSSGVVIVVVSVVAVVIVLELVVYDWLLLVQLGEHEVYPCQKRNQDVVRVLQLAALTPSSLASSVPADSVLLLLLLRLLCLLEYLYILLGIRREHQ